MDYLAGILELCGAWLVGDRRRLGFLVNLAGCLCWCYVSASRGVYGLLLVAVPLAAVNGLNWWRWR